VPYTSVTNRGVTLLCFPPGDVALSRLALRKLDELKELETEQLQAALVAYYPNLVVRPRHRLAAIGEAAGSATWYVYRDGRFSPFAEEGAWWELPDTARVVLDSEGHYLDANDEALAMLNVSREQLLTEHRSGDFTTSEAGQNVPWVLQLLKETGVLHSTSVLVPAGGLPTKAIEYRFMLDADGPGRHVALMREVPLAAARPEEPISRAS
jgi:PAS domain-containing protein